MTTDTLPLQVAMLLYPGFTLLDLSGPQDIFCRHGQTHLVAATREPVVSDGGMAILPSHTYADAPRTVDVLFVPGGFGTNAVLTDQGALAYLREAAPKARYITSVCSGALVLAAAGLLDGYRATSHWASLDILRAYGVEVVNERVVVDRNRVTGGGVTAGIDFGLRLLSLLYGEPVARTAQLLMEYDPQPPFDCGSPAAAGPELTAAVRARMASVVDDGLEIARRQMQD